MIDYATEWPFPQSVHPLGVEAIGQCFRGRLRGIDATHHVIVNIYAYCTHGFLHYVGYLPQNYIFFQHEALPQNFLQFLVERLGDIHVGDVAGALEDNVNAFRLVLAPLLRSLQTAVFKLADGNHQRIVALGLFLLVDQLLDVRQMPDLPLLEPHGQLSHFLLGFGGHDESLAHFGESLFGEKRRHHDFEVLAVVLEPKVVVKVVDVVTAYAAQRSHLVGKLVRKVSGQHCTYGNAYYIGFQHVLLLHNGRNHMGSLRDVAFANRGPVTNQVEGNHLASRREIVDLRIKTSVVHKGRMQENDAGLGVALVRPIVNATFGKRIFY